MTIEEKQKALIDFCIGRSCAGSKCPLFEIETPHGCIPNELYPEEIDKHYELVFGKKEPPKDDTDNPYWNNICKLQAKQREKGIETYGQGLEDNHEPVMKRIQHIQEELIDALMYLEWVKDGLGGHE